MFLHLFFCCTGFGGVLKTFLLTVYCITNPSTVFIPDDESLSEVITIAIIKYFEFIK